jgi:glucose/mannose-6-phosphate isomerase
MVRLAERDGLVERRSDEHDRRATRVHLTAKGRRFKPVAGRVLEELDGLARAALGDRASRPIVVSRGYELPPWTTPDTMVLCCSYSGDTEETLACYEAASALGAPRAVATTGGALADAARADGAPVIGLPAGFQPRGAVAYLTVAALEAAAACGSAISVRSEVDVAAAHAETLVAEWGPGGNHDCLAKALARGLHGTIPQIAGSGLTASVAYRWKTQINENAKAPAFAHELPELDHNEVVGWSGAAGLGRFSAVFLADCDQHPRTRQRIDLTKALVEPDAAGAFVVESRGESRTERMVSLVLLGDLVSVYLAVLREVDPTPVEVIDRLKTDLAEVP